MRLGVGVARFGGLGARPFKGGTQDAGLKVRRYKDPGAEGFLSSRTPFGMTVFFVVEGNGPPRKAGPTRAETPRCRPEGTVLQRPKSGGIRHFADSVRNDGVFFLGSINACALVEAVF
jgi:hypothetical protein